MTSITNILRIVVAVISIKSCQRHLLAGPSFSEQTHFVISENKKENIHKVFI